ncbi:hypothetical protein Nm8I071_37720 [Nonomuraea sp. TT08I-71]|nr:hypothetical protein Nm8I071_37720 [Nonomuraea sp. TT08I-71]
MPFSPLKEIAAEGVFGAFNYHVLFSSHEPEAEQADRSRLSIIYGENGTGKTTLLQAVFHLLSLGSRHRVALARSPIKRLRAEFVSGAVVLMEKEEVFSASCRLSIAIPGVDTVHLNVSPNDVVGGRTPGLNPESAAYQRALRSLSPTSLFVGDDRSVDSEEFDSSENFAGLKYMSPVELRDLAGGVGILTWARTKELEAALSRAERALRNAAIGGLSSGGSSTGSIYSDVVKRIRTSTADVSAVEAKERLVSLVDALAERTPAFSCYGLVPLEQIDELKREIDKLRRNSRNLPLIYQVLVPYLSSLEAQLNELETPRHRIDTYVNSVNGFLKRKRLAFHLRLGLLLLDEKGERLSPEVLSSGEKHLLLLMSYAVVARDMGGVFIIDEPELSLGIEWKRSLIEELLRCTAGSDVQFLVASHSVEVMSPYRDRIVTPVEVPESS